MSIGVPRVFRPFVHRGHAYIVTERMGGVPLPRCRNSLLEGDLPSILLQLRTAIRKSRTMLLLLLPDQKLRRRLAARLPHLAPKVRVRVARDFYLWLREGRRPDEHPGRMEEQGERDIKAMAAGQDGPCSASDDCLQGLESARHYRTRSKVVGIID